MKRNKMSIEIVAKLYDEQGQPAGKITIDETDGDKIEASSDYGADVLALAESLKKTHQHWLEADEATLDAGVSMALGVAMEEASDG